jgi:DNA-binding transcriptional MerR regulator
MTSTQDFLTTFQAAELAGVKPDTIKAWKRQRLLPETGRKGPHGVALYARADVLEVMRQKGISLLQQKQDVLPEVTSGSTEIERLSRQVDELRAELAEVRERHSRTFREIARLAVNVD